ncbi:hypothetical protein NE237_008940 [Protea cynaroides]|uniref:Uncharacterized protein n=1 Tax=Protea cynaroides TaxID=273540 RepID=A0A9Q0QZT5_9MAGN|nr:hypothetical protein NE237_008940 [Protea cynaroides]
MPGNSNGVLPFYPFCLRSCGGKIQIYFSGDNTTLKVECASIINFVLKECGSVRRINGKRMKVEDDTAIGNDMMNKGKEADEVKRQPNDATGDNESATSVALARLQEAKMGERRRYGNKSVDSNGLRSSEPQRITEHQQEYICWDDDVIALQELIEENTKDREKTSDLDNICRSGKIKENHDKGSMNYEQGTQNRQETANRKKLQETYIMN